MAQIGEEAVLKAVRVALNQRGQHKALAHAHDYPVGVEAQNGRAQRTRPLGLGRTEGSRVGRAPVIQHILTRPQGIVQRVLQARIGTENLGVREQSTRLVIGHKWQKIKMVFYSKRWRELNRGLWATPRDGVTTLSGVAAAVSALAAVIGILVK
jgi:hypothetical protein